MELFIALLALFIFAFGFISGYWYREIRMRKSINGRIRIDNSTGDQLMFLELYSDKENLFHVFKDRKYATFSVVRENYINEVREKNTPYNE